jgi:hypothetical protein
MSRIRRNLLIGLGVAALAVPAGAVAKQSEDHGNKGKGKGHAKAKGVAYVFKGTYTGANETDSTHGSVEVAKGNSRVRKGGFIGETVEFDFTDARFVVADGPDEGEDRDLEDVQVGDRVLVKAKLPRKEPGDQPFPAKRLVDQTHPPTDSE